jgi:hypothetical protein
LRLWLLAEWVAFVLEWTFLLLALAVAALGVFGLAVFEVYVLILYWSQ